MTKETLMEQLQAELGKWKFEELKEKIIAEEDRI